MSDIRTQEVLTQFGPPSLSTGPLTKEFERHESAQDLAELVRVLQELETRMNEIALYIDSLDASRSHHYLAEVKPLEDIFYKEKISAHAESLRRQSARQKDSGNGDYEISGKPIKIPSYNKYLQVLRDQQERFIRIQYYQAALDDICIDLENAGVEVIRHKSKIHTNDNKPGFIYKKPGKAYTLAPQTNLKEAKFKLAIKAIEIQVKKLDTLDEGMDERFKQEAIKIAVSKILGDHPGTLDDQHEKKLFDASLKAKRKAFMEHVSKKLYDEVQLEKVKDVTTYKDDLATVIFHSYEKNITVIITFEGLPPRTCTYRLFNGTPREAGLLDDHSEDDDTHIRSYSERKHIFFSELWTSLPYDLGKGTKYPRPSVEKH